MNAAKKPVGPLDIKQWLADRKAGNKPPRTDSIEVFLEPELSAEYDTLVDTYNRLVAEDEKPGIEGSITDGRSDHTAELDALEARMDAIKAEAEASKVTLTFRSYEVGDQEAIAAEQVARGIRDDQYEHISVLRTAHYSLEPKLSVEEVTELAKAIGFVQFDAVCAVWLKLVFGKAMAPKLLRPLRSRGITTP